MGICNSNTNQNQKLRKNKINQKNEKFHLKQERKILKNNLLQKDYILSPKDAKRDDITKYYKLSSEILGEGAGGKVCLGENSNGKYAIKRITKEKVKNIDALIKEVKCSKLHHENIIKYYEVYEDLKTISFVMELGDGDLFDFIINTPEHKLSIDLCIELTLQILNVIKYLHYDLGIIHRDLKPENFMIIIGENNNPIIKLIDFGLATNIPEDGKLLYDNIGTIDYSAPEVINYCGYNEKMDIWAIGIIIFNMLTGYEPFKSDNTSLLKEEIKFKKINFNIIEDEQMRNLIKRMMERDMNKRINAKEAYDIVLKIKQERDMIYEKELDKHIMEREKLKQQKEEYYDFMNTYINKIY